MVNNVSTASSVPRILFILNAFEEDAPNKIIAHIARATAASQYSCAVAALARDGSFRTAFSSCETFFLNMPSVRNLSGVGRLKHLISTFKPDIVHLTLLRPTLIAGTVSAMLPRSGRPVIIANHNGAHEWEEGGIAAKFIVPTWFRVLARRLDRIIAVSDSSRHELIRAGFRPDNISVIHNGVDTEKFKPGAKPSDNNQRLIATAGNLRHIKGHELLIGAAARLIPRYPNLQFTIWGEGPERPHLESLIGQRNLGGRFHLPGQTDDLADRLPGCAVFVQPSLREAFGLAAAEAMSCGLPVVVSNAGGLPELVENEKNGLVFESGNAADLASKLDRFIADDEFRNRMGAAARERIIADFSLTKMIESYLRLYHSLITSKLQ